MEWKETSTTITQKPASTIGARGDAAVLFSEEHAETIGLTNIEGAQDNGFIGERSWHDVRVGRLT